MNDIKKKKSVILKIFFCYYIFISFLFPRGYIPLNSTYKNFSAMLIWSSVLLIWIYIIIKCIKEVQTKRKTSYRKKMHKYYFVFYFSTFNNYNNKKRKNYRIAAINSLSINLYIYNSIWKKKFKNFIELY